MSKIVESYPEHKKARKQNILAKQKDIDKKNSAGREAALKQEREERDFARKGKVAAKKREEDVLKSEKLTLVDALKSLNNNDDAHWTKAGAPNLNVLIELTGKRVKREDFSDKIVRTI